MDCSRLRLAQELSVVEPESSTLYRNYQTWFFNEEYFSERVPNNLSERRVIGMRIICQLIKEDSAIIKTAKNTVGAAWSVFEFHHVSSAYMTVARFQLSTLRGTLSIAF